MFEEVIYEELIYPEFARKVGREFVKEYYDDLFRLPGFVHRYYKDKSVLFRIDDDGFPSKTTTIKDINRMILSGYDKYLKVIVKSMGAHFFDFEDRVQIRVSGSLIGKDGVTQRFYQMFVIEPQEQEGGCYFVLYDDQFLYKENVNKGSDIDVEDDDAVSDVEDGNKGLVRGDDANKSRDGNKVLVSDVETNKADFGEFQDGSVIDAEPQTGVALSSSSPGSGSKEDGWIDGRLKKKNRKREDETGSQSQKISRKENESTTNTIIIDRTTNTTTIDLHGETVESAMLKVKKELEYLSSLGSKHTLILITGRGKHSAGRKPLIKKAIIKLLRKIEIEWKIDNNNKGRLVVTVDGKREFIFSSDSDSDTY